MEGTKSIPPIVPTETKRESYRGMFLKTNNIDDVNKKNTMLKKSHTIKTKEQKLYLSARREYKKEIK